MLLTVVCGCLLVAASYAAGPTGPTGPASDAPTAPVAEQDSAAPAPAEPGPTGEPGATPFGAGPGSGVAGSAPPGELVVWARGDLTWRFAADVAALPAVTAATHVRSATIGLTGSRGADGAVVDDLDGDLRIPVEVVAVDPGGYAATVPPGTDRDIVAALRPGQALLTRTATRLRDIGAGGAVDLTGLADLEVAGVISDDAVGRDEIVIHVDDADAAGLDTDGTVHLLHRAGAGVETAHLTEQIEALVPEDATARIVDASAGAPRRRAPLVLSLPEIKERFGEFAFSPRPDSRIIDADPAFRREHVVNARVPILGVVTCHRGIIDDLRGALQQIVDEGRAGEIDPDRYAGCFYPRKISASRDRLSSHSWGISVDINVDVSLPGFGPPPSEAVIDAFAAHGFRWGGEFITPDNHHFEWVGDAVRGE